MYCNYEVYSQAWICEILTREVDAYNSAFYFIANHHLPQAPLSIALWAFHSKLCWTWWHIGRVEAFRPEDRGFESCCSRHVGTLGKSLTHSCLWCFGVKLLHSIHAVSGALLSSSELEEAL